MIKSKDEILEAISRRMGDDRSDEDIALLEDITDTFDDFDVRTKDSTEWKKKYEENDKEWRQKYTDRFFNKEPIPEPEPEPKTEPKPIMTYDDLFKTV